MNNQEIINKKYENAINGLRGIFELCCPDDCHNCKFAIYNNEKEHVCSLHHTMNEIAKRIKK